MANVQLTINDKPISVPAGTTILEAAEQNGIRIPTLCNLKKLDPRANCRMCVVEVEKSRTFQPSCATKVTDGMVVRTDTPALREARKMTLQLILSRHAVDCHHCLRIGSSKCADLDPTFCEMCFFCDCVRDGFCELQSLAREYGVDVLPYEIEADNYPIDTSLGSVIRNPNKCIKCRRCVDACCEVQTVHTLSMQHRGSEMEVIPALGKPLAESPCVRCGRCVTVCPTGSVFMQEHKDELIYAGHQYGITTVAQLDPNILPELEELFKMPKGSLSLARVAAGLEKIGIDHVMTDDSAQTISAAQGVSMLKARLAKNAEPVILTNSFAAQNFIDRYFSDLKEQVVAYPSAQQAFGRYIKEKFAIAHELDAAKLRTVVISNDNENGAEAHETGSVNFSLNARELYRIFMRTGGNMNTLRDTTLYLSDNTAVLPALFDRIHWNMEKDPEICTVDFEGKSIQAAIAHNLGQARRLLDDVRSGKCPYQVIRIIA